MGHVDLVHEKVVYLPGGRQAGRALGSSATSVSAWHPVLSIFSSIRDELCFSPRDDEVAFSVNHTLYVRRL